MTPLSDAEEVLFHREAPIVARSSAAVATAAVLYPLVAESHIVIPRFVTPSFVTYRRLTEARRLARFATAAPDCYCVTSCPSQVINRL